MSYILKSTTQSTIVIDDNCGSNKFFEVADVMQKELAISFLQQAKQHEKLDWDFEYKQQPLSLHFDVYTGLSINAKTNTARNCFVGKELGDFLHSKVY